MNFLVAMNFSAQSCKIKNGPYKEFHENGALKLIGQYKNYERIGDWKEYYDSGEIYRTYSYTDGKIDDMKKRFYKDGTLQSEVKKVNGKLYHRNYYDSGKLFYERIIKDGFYREYLENQDFSVCCIYYTFSHS